MPDLSEFVFSRAEIGLVQRKGLLALDIFRSDVGDLDFLAADDGT